MSVQTPGSGSLLKVSISASFTQIAKQTKFGTFDRKRAAIEFTGLADTVETFVAGIKRTGEIGFEGYWDADDVSQAYLETSYAGALTEAWKATYANAGACDITWSGFLTALTIGETAVDGLVMISGSIRPTTAITVTP